MIDLGLFSLEKSLSKVFGCIKLHKKGSWFFFYLKKLFQLRDQFCSSALVIDTFYVKYCSILTHYYKIDLLIKITFLSKRNIFLDSFFYAILCDRKLRISCLSISIMSTNQWATSQYVPFVYLKNKLYSCRWIHIPLLVIFFFHPELFYPRQIILVHFSSKYFLSIVNFSFYEL